MKQYLDLMRRVREHGVAKGDRTYTRVKGTEANCPDPSAPPAASKAESKDKDDDDDDDDDAKADEKMQKLIKQGQEFIERQKQK